MSWESRAVKQFWLGLNFRVSISVNLWVKSWFFFGEVTFILRYNYVAQIWNLHSMKYCSFCSNFIRPKFCSAFLWLLYWLYNYGDNIFEKPSPKEFFDAFMMIWVWKMYSLCWKHCRRGRNVKSACSCIRAASCLHL